MTPSETIQVIEILRRAYPDYLKPLPGENMKTMLDNTVRLWAELLEPFPLEMCAFAAKRLITESPYPPKISDLIQHIKELANAGRDDAVDAWNALYNAASRASVVTPEEYESLPYEVRRFCGSMAGLQDFGMLATKTFITVTRGQFMKVFEGLRRSKETLELMPPELLALTQKAVRKAMPATRPKRLPEAEVQVVEPVPMVSAMPVKDTSPLTEEEWNSRRNAMLARLDASVSGS